jgi:hypothetical protein
MDGFVDESTDCIFLESGVVRLKKLARNNSIAPGSNVEIVTPNSPRGIKLAAFFPLTPMFFSQVSRIRRSLPIR